MDDIQLVLYIIFVIIAVLVRALKSKNKQAPPPPPRQSSDSPKPRQKPMSFEDLLREFEGKTKEPAPSREPQTVEREAYEYEEEIQNDEEIKQAYEESVNKAKKFKTIDELVDLEEDDRHTGNFKHFGGYEEPEESRASEFNEMLKSADGAKKAIILSEIINRKY